MKILMLSLFCFGAIAGVGIVIYLKSIISLIPQRVYEYNPFIMKLSDGAEVIAEIKIGNNILLKKFEFSGIPRAGELIRDCFSRKNQLGKLDISNNPNTWLNGKSIDDGITLLIQAVQEEVLDVEKCSYLHPERHLKIQLVEYGYPRKSLEKFFKNGWNRKA